MLFPQCDGEMKIVAFITEAVAISRILNHLGEPTSPPRLLPTHGPPLGRYRAQILAKAIRRRSWRWTTSMISASQGR